MGEIMFSWLKGSAVKSHPICDCDILSFHNVKSLSTAAKAGFIVALLHHYVYR